MSNQFFAPGHTACSGCAQSLAARLVLEAAGPEIIVANATGCLEVFTTRAPQSSWGVPWIHSLFENVSAVASGIEAALRADGRSEKVKVLAFGGDGGTADIGMGSLSGLMERGQDVLYVCYDNEAYMNTGIQRSGLTPPGGNTTTSPAGKKSIGKLEGKKDMPAIMAAHKASYVATANASYPQDLKRKIKKALSLPGAKYIQILVPCPLGWRYEGKDTILAGKLAVETGLFPLFEMENGVVTKVMKLKEKKSVDDYLKLQRRFAHLYKSEAGKEELAKIQTIADQNIEKFGLLEKEEAKA